MTGLAEKVVWYRYDPSAPWDRRFEVTVADEFPALEPQFYSALGFEAVCKSYEAQGYVVREMPTLVEVER